MSDIADTWGSGRRLATFVDELKELGPEGFLDRYRHPFLLLHGDPTNGPGGNDASVTFTVETTFYALLVRAAPKSPLPYVSAGRAAGNDIVLSHSTVSSVHAYFRLDENGQVTLQDAGSRNRTFIGGDRVPTRSEGPPVPLHPGANVRFGSVSTTFLPAAMFRDFIGKMASY